MGISAVGYVAQRLLPARLGLPVAGLASGFVSSAATVHAMGQRATREPGRPDEPGSEVLGTCSGRRVSVA